MDSFELIRRREGFIPAAAWDVNHWRVGYGSDTWVDDNGVQHTVTADTVVTREQAEADLQLRVPEFQDSGILPYVDRDMWESLPTQTQAAITSLAYNYGGLSGLPSLARAINSGDANQIADAVEARAGDNSGVNKSRRVEEANIIRGHPLPPGLVGEDAKGQAVGTKIDLQGITKAISKPAASNFAVPLSRGQGTMARVNAMLGPAQASIGDRVTEELNKPSIVHTADGKVRLSELAPPGQADHGTPAPRSQGTAARTAAMFKPSPANPNKNPSQNTPKAAALPGPTRFTDASTLADRVNTALDNTSVPIRQISTAGQSPTAGQPIKAAAPATTNLTQLAASTKATTAQLKAIRDTQTTQAKASTQPTQAQMQAIRNPDPAPGVIRTANPIAGQAVIPAGVRPTVNMPTAEKPATSTKLPTSAQLQAIRSVPAVSAKTVAPAKQASQAQLQAIREVPATAAAAPGRAATNVQKPSLVKQGTLAADPTGGIVLGSLINDGIAKPTAITTLRGGTTKEIARKQAEAAAKNDNGISLTGLMGDAADALLGNSFSAIKSFEDTNRSSMQAKASAAGGRSAAVAESGGYLFAPKSGGGYVQVGRADMSKSAAQTYAEKTAKDSGAVSRPGQSLSQSGGLESNSKW